MPLDAAEAGISLSEEYLRQTLANSARFRTWAGVTSVAAALERIHACGLPLPQPRADGTVPAAFSPDHFAALRPFALVWADENVGWRTARVATQAWDEAGQLKIALEQEIPPELVHTIAELDRRFKNHLGVIANEMTVLAYQAGFLAIDQIVVRGPWRCTPEEEQDQGKHIYAQLQVTWGLGRGV